MHWLKPIFGIALFFNCQLALPDNTDPSLTRVLEMDIAQLLNTPLTVASTRPTTLTSSPGIVSVYKMTDMRALGLHSVKEVLSFIPGFIIQDVALGHSSVMIRGVNENFNQKVLFLLDDTPYWMPAHSEIPLLGIPIAAIDRIEVIRGPGAVIHGTNGGAGVIKIVTKRHASQYSEISASSQQQYIVNHYGNLSLPIADINWAAQWQDDDGYQGEYSGFSNQAFSEAPTTGKLPKREETSAAYIHYQQGNLGISLQAHRSRMDGVAITSSLFNQAIQERTGYLIQTDCLVPGDNFQAKLYADYNVFYLQIPTENFPSTGQSAQLNFEDHGKENYRKRIGGKIDFDIKPNLQWLVGYDWEQRSTGNYDNNDKATNALLTRLISSNNTIEKALFSEFSWQNQLGNMVLGARYTDNEKSGDKITPRIAWVYQASSQHTFKLIYSVGFNAPNFTQQLIDLATVQGAIDLKPELVKTTDFAYSFSGQHSLFSANIYYLDAEDFIQRKIVDGVIRFDNDGDFHRYGLEVDFQYQKAPWHIFSSLAYNHQGNQRKINDNTAEFVSKESINLGVNYQLLNQSSIGFSIRHIGNRGIASSQQKININWQQNWQRWQGTIRLKNLLDEKLQNVDVQDYNRARLIPGGAGRTLKISLRYLW